MDENKIKHLEFVQANIARMNQCSFQIKGWMITVVTALLALFAASVNSETGRGNNIFIYIAVIPTMVFWLLDSYYLQQERKFRGMYNDLIGITHYVDISEFEMPINRYEGCKYCFLRVLFSKTECMLYLVVIIGLIAAGVLL